MKTKEIKIEEDQEIFFIKEDRLEMWKIKVGVARICPCCNKLSATGVKTIEAPYVLQRSIYERDDFIFDFIEDYDPEFTECGETICQFCDNAEFGLNNEPETVSITCVKPDFVELFKEQAKKQINGNLYDADEMQKEIIRLRNELINLKNKIEEILK